MQRRGPLLIVIAIVAVGALLLILDAVNTHETVRAADGSEVVIRLDPAEITEWSGAPGSVNLDGTRKYGVSVKPAVDLPDGNPAEANLVGTKAR
jgi:hypothetical protein